MPDPANLKLIEEQGKGKTDFRLAEIGSLWRFDPNFKYSFFTNVIAFSKLIPTSKRETFYQTGQNLPVFCKVFSVDHKSTIIKLSKVIYEEDPLSCYKILCLDYKGSPKIGWIDDNRVGIFRYLKRAGE